MYVIVMVVYITVRLGSIEEEDEAVSSVSPLTTTPTTTTCTAEPMDMTEDSDHNIGDRNLQESAPENAVVADCIQMEDETFEPISTNGWFISVQLYFCDV